MMLCIAVKAFHTLQEELKKKTLCLVDVRYENQGRVLFLGKEDGMEGFDKFFFHIRFGGIRSCDWILFEWENACSSKAVVPTAIIGDPQ